MLVQGSVRVLLIDADAFFASACASRLEAEGFSVVCEGGSDRGFETALRERPDTILLGAEHASLLDRLKRAPEFVRVPVVVLAERPCAEEAERCLRTGARTYLVKTHLVADDVARTLRDLLGLN
ncbi:MAG: hypothetical protein QY323_01555 [Patescibacteria group bacterium]|nr:MAG: hypothetical protein QY323_01555 [Patescibacteria group bacterium]